MADKNIKEGDKVSWKWGAGAPSGIVDEVETEGKLEIESKGKLVHKNADPSNPAIHVAHKGNDVVKRASELTKENSTEDEEAGNKDGVDDAMKEAEADKNGKDEKAGTATGKRERVDTPADDMEKAKPVEKEQEVAEKETGKEAKKVKLDETIGGETEGAARGEKEAVAEKKDERKRVEASAESLKKKGKRVKESATTTPVTRTRSKGLGD